MTTAVVVYSVRLTCKVSPIVKVVLLLYRPLLASKVFCDLFALIQSVAGDGNDSTKAQLTEKESQGVCGL